MVVSVYIFETCNPTVCPYPDAPRAQYSQINPMLRCSVDCHPARYRPVLVIRELLHDFCFLATHLALHDVCLQTHAEIRSAHDGVDNCQDDQNDRDNCEACQTLPDCHVILRLLWLIHSHKLKDEVCQSTEEEDNGSNHANFILATSPESCHKQNDDCDGNRSNRKRAFSDTQVSNNDEKLYGKSEEEEEVELEECDINLV